MAMNDDGMAYLLWWDDGCDELISQVGPEFSDSVNALPFPVEKFDIFRIVALNTFGGIVRSPSGSHFQKLTNISILVRRCRYCAAPHTSYLA